SLLSCRLLFCFVIFNCPATPETYTLSLHDALPILPDLVSHDGLEVDFQTFDCIQHEHSQLFIELVNANSCVESGGSVERVQTQRDRKSTRLNSSHVKISYAVFCLKKKKKHKNHACI